MLKPKLFAKEVETLLRAAKFEKNVKISCIVPAYNEESRIAKVLNYIKDYEFFDEILVVNDGSTDKTVEVVTEFTLNSRIKLLCNDGNQGKAATVTNGVNNVDGELIVLIDADLVGLTHENIDKLLYYILCEDYSMTILDRASDRAKLIGGWSNFTRFWGGERAFWKADFNKLGLKLDKKSGYLLEAELNLYFINAKRNVISIYCKNLSTIYKNKKVGNLKGLSGDLAMYRAIYKRVSIRNFYKHFKYIEEDRIKKLYEIRNNTHAHMSAIMIIVGFIGAVGTFLLLNSKSKKKD
jgi:glycosyltransferase involved in cell wall biosynthesis